VRLAATHQKADEMGRALRVVDSSSMNIGLGSTIRARITDRLRTSNALLAVSVDEVRRYRQEVVVEESHQETFEPQCSGGQISSALPLQKRTAKLGVAGSD
jgi:hypothetical protein